MNRQIIRLLLVTMIALGSFTVPQASAADGMTSEEAGEPEAGVSCSFCAPVCWTDLVGFCTVRGCWNEIGNIVCQTGPCVGSGGPIWPARITCTTY